MIRKHIGILQALSVIEIVNDLVTSSFHSGVEAFDNCREQGLCFMTDSRAHIAIANQRHSDQIVVYHYSKTAFTRNIPHDDDPGWKGVCFGMYEFEKAAKYVIELINQDRKDKKRAQGAV